MKAARWQLLSRLMDPADASAIGVGQPVNPLQVLEGQLADLQRKQQPAQRYCPDTRAFFIAVKPLAAIAVRKPTHIRASPTTEYGASQSTIGLTSFT